LNKYKRKVFRKYVNLREFTKDLLKMIVLPGFDRMSLFEVMSFFFKGLFEGALTTRAASVAFSFFLAIFPFIIFIFTLIPYIPISDFQITLLDLFEDIIPPETYEMVESTIFDIVMRQQTGLLSLSFILTFFFSTNGVSAIMDGFNSSWHAIETKSWWQQRLAAMFIMVSLSLLVIIAIALITMGGHFINWMLAHNWIQGDFTVTMLLLLKWLVVIGLTFLSVSLLYYYAPAIRRQYHFFSPGSILATALLIFGTLAFNFYIQNFSRYNALYGSIGTLLIFLLWLYFNALILLIGFELNASIKQARKKNGNKPTAKLTIAGATDTNS
jgi:membrane protein